MITQEGQGKWQIKTQLKFRGILMTFMIFYFDTNKRVRQLNV